MKRDLQKAIFDQVIIRFKIDGLAYENYEEFMTAIEKITTEKGVVEEDKRKRMREI